MAEDETLLATDGDNFENKDYDDLDEDFLPSTR
jgi:hypothetical protein